MRHLVGFVLAVVTSAALFFAVGWGVTQITALHGQGTGLGPDHALASTHGIAAMVAVLGTGLLLGLLLAVPWFSPLAAGLPGLVLLGWTALLIMHSQYTLRYLPMPGSSFAGGLVYLLVHGVLGLVGAAMIVPMLVPSRWRRTAYYAADEEEEDLSVPSALGLVP
jgi:hypothetical protein